MSSITKHPKGLYLLFFTEMAERFSYYGMRALFVLYLIAAFFDEKVSSQIYGSYTGLVYLTPLLGGYIADRYWGNRRSIIVGGILMSIGQFLMFASACIVKQSIFAENGSIDATIDNSLSTYIMFCGLGILIIGNGFFKPNISTMVGDLYSPADSRKDSAYTIFYMGINLGAFIAPFICGTLGEGSWNNLSPFKWGFFSAGIAMVISTIVFACLKSKYLITSDGLQIGLVPSKSELIKNKEKQQTEQTNKKSNTLIRAICCITATIAMFFIFLNSTEATSTDFFIKFNDYTSAAIYAISIALPIFIITDNSLTKIDKCRIGVIYIIALFVIFFWSAFEQAGSSLTIFADKNVDRMIGDFEFKTTWFQSINPIAVVLFAPIMAILWEKLAKRKIEPSSPKKQAIGLLLLSIGYFIIAFATHGVDVNTRISMIWLFALYIIHTLGELSLSPIGLSMVNKLSPVHFASLLMGVWFMSNAASNILAGKLAALMPTVSNQEPSSFCGFTIDSLDSFFILFALMALASSIILFALCPLLKKMMKGIE